MALALATEGYAAPCSSREREQGFCLSRAVEASHFRLQLRDPGQYRLAGDPVPASAAADPAQTDRAEPLGPFHELVAEAAQRHGLDPALVHAVITVESNYNARAISHKGAIGLMQIMPELGARYGVSAAELRDPIRNVHTGTRHLSDLIYAFGGNLMLALAGYNAGEQAVRRHGSRVPPFLETQRYVVRVLRFYRELRARL